MDTSALKITFITADAFEQGTYFRWHNIAIGLTKLGHSVHVFSIDYSDNATARTEDRDGVKYTVGIGAKGKSYFGTINHPLGAFARISEAYEKSDIVHVFQPFLTVYLPWKYSAKKKAALTIFDWDDLWVDEERNKQKRNFRGRWDYRFAAYFENKIPSLHQSMTTCSSYLSNLALQRGAKSADVIPNGFWKYDIPEKQLSRKRLGLKEDAIYFGFMGRTGFELHWCFDALAECTKLGLNIRFALCGPAESVLENVSKEVRESIDYLGSLPPLETRFFSAGIDLGLLPLMKTDFNESRFPIKFAEYMAAGLPVLCSEVGEISKYGKNFPWVLKAGVTQDEWKAAFIAAAKSAAEGSLPKVDLPTIYNSLSWDVIAKQTEKIYLNRLNAL